MKFRFTKVSVFFVLSANFFRYGSKVIVSCPILATFAVEKQISTMTKPLIFISNDDSVEAPGLRHLIDCVADMGDIIAVAPAEPHSGQSSAITVNRPLRLKECDSYHGARILSVDGTPVDCVKLGLHAVVDRRPDIMLSGCNHGSNAGNCITYSGTMGAAIEATMAGIPAIGYSLLDHSMKADFSRTVPYIRNITEKVLASGLERGICLNVNFPADVDIEGLKVVRAARGYWSEEYKEYTDPFGKPFYWLTGRFVNIEPDDSATDEYWLVRNYATVVPARADQSAIDCIDAVSNLLGL